MDSLRAVAKALIPGSVEFLAIGVVAGLLLLFLRGHSARWGRRWLAILAGLYVALTLQGTSDLLILGLTRGARPISTVADAGGARLVVVLSNGADPIAEADPTQYVVNLQSGFSAREAARVYRLIGDPLVIASGGRPPSSGDGPPESQALAAALERLGVPASRIVEESTSATTREQAVNVGQWLRARGETRFVLITAPEHMRRASAAFRVLGFDPVESPSSLRYGEGPFWLPSFYALFGSRHAVYEYLALAFYRLRGWA